VIIPAWKRAGKPRGVLELLRRRPGWGVIFRPAHTTPTRGAGGLAQGASTVQIADRLVISTETVRNHVRALLRALRVHSRLEAIVEARRRGLLG